MNLDDINSRLTATGGPAVKLNVGDEIAATLVAAEYRPKTDFTTGEVQTWADGRTKEQLVLTVRRDGADEDERIFCKPTAEKALGKALKDGGHKLAVGGRIRMRRLPDIPATQRGMAPAQDYAVKWEAPVAQPAGDDW
jgi:hypothetical protein